jgi:hypothetical protein
MVNHDIVRYLQEGLKRGFSLEVLRQKLFEGGFDQGAVNEAVNFIGTAQIQRPPQQPVITQTPAANPAEATPKIEEKPAVSTAAPSSTATAIQPATNAPAKSGGVKWIKTSGILGIVIVASLIVILVLGMIISDLLSNSITLIAVSLVLAILISFYCVGFIKMGKVTNVNSIGFGSMVLMVVTIILTILFILVSLLTLSGILGTILVILTGVMLLLLLVGQLIFSIGLIKASQNVRYAKAAGILNLFVFLLSIAIGVLGSITIYGGNSILDNLNGDIARMATAIMDLGVLAIILALIFLFTGLMKFLGMIFEILSLFSASKVYEQGLVSS